jgi:hypothetical protein
MSIFHPYSKSHDHIPPIIHMLEYEVAMTRVH